MAERTQTETRFRGQVNVTKEKGEKKSPSHTYGLLESDKYQVEITRNDRETLFFIATRLPLSVSI